VDVPKYRNQCGIHLTEASLIGSAVALTSDNAVPSLRGLFASGLCLGGLCLSGLLSVARSYVNVDFGHVMRMTRRDWSRLSECGTISNIHEFSVVIVIR